MKWDKNTFMADMREKCSREIAKIGNSICEFSEKHAADISWGRGNDHGTLTSVSYTHLTLPTNREV